MTLWGSGGAAFLVGGDEGGHQVAQGTLDVRVGQLAVHDGRVHGGDADTLLEGYGARDAEHLLGIFTGPLRATRRRAHRDHGDRKAVDGGGATRAGRPVDRVLEHAGHRAVVLRGGHDKAVGAAYGVPERHHGGGMRVGVEVLV